MKSNGMHGVEHAKLTAWSWLCGADCVSLNAWSWLCGVECTAEKAVTWLQETVQRDPSVCPEPGEFLYLVHRYLRGERKGQVTLCRNVGKDEFNTGTQHNYAPGSPVSPHIQGTGPVASAASRTAAEEARLLLRKTALFALHIPPEAVNSPSQAKATKFLVPGDLVVCVWHQKNGDRIFSEYSKLNALQFL